MQPAGMAALFQAAGRRFDSASTFDFGFALGPRINAAGRLADMTLGIECLLTDDPARAAALARELDSINRTRRDLEGAMREQAQQLAQRLCAAHDQPARRHQLVRCRFPRGRGGHRGLAHQRAAAPARPLCFAASSAPGKEHELKGSGRSIAGFSPARRARPAGQAPPWPAAAFWRPRHGGGLHHCAGTFPVVCPGLERDCPGRVWMRPRSRAAWKPMARWHRKYLRADLVDMLAREVWGQGFAPPTFSDEVQVQSQRLVGEEKNHLQLRLLHQGQPVDAIWFGRTEPLPAQALLAFRLDVNEWRGQRRVQFLVEAMQDRMGLRSTPGRAIYRWAAQCSSPALWLECSRRSAKATASALSKKAMWMMVCHINTFSS